MNLREVKLPSVRPVVYGCNVSTLFRFSEGDSLVHVKVQNKGEMLDLYGGESFKSLSELVDYYIRDPQQLMQRNGVPIVLRFVFLIVVELVHLSILLFILLDVFVIFISIDILHLCYLFNNFVDAICLSRVPLLPLWC